MLPTCGIWRGIGIHAFDEVRLNGFQKPGSPVTILIQPDKLVGLEQVARWLRVRSLFDLCLAPRLSSAPRMGFIDYKVEEAVLPLTPKLGGCLSHKPCAAPLPHKTISAPLEIPAGHLAI